jgi:hypothetical protein
MERLRQIIYPNSKKRRNIIVGIQKLADSVNFPVNSIHDLSALSYIVKNTDIPNKEELSVLLIEYQKKMLTGIDKEHNIKKGKANEKA